MSRVKKLRFHLNIPYDEYLLYYQGAASNIRMQADNGQIVVFPANRLQSFVRHDGVKGHFEIRFDQDNRFISLKRLSD